LNERGRCGSAPPGRHDELPEEPEEEADPRHITENHHPQGFSRIGDGETP
jgi:hypothetical protein